MNNLICRTCLQQINGDSMFFPLDFIDSSSEKVISVRHKLYVCVPGIDLNIVPNAILCGSCLDVVNCSYKFNKLCYKSEEEIKDYLNNVECNSDFFDLGKIAVCNVDIKKEKNCEEIEPCFEFVKQEIVKEELPNDVMFKLNESTHGLKEELFNLSRVEVSEVNMIDSSITKMFRCTHCNYSCVNKSLLKIHLMIHMEVELNEYSVRVTKKKFNCTECDYRSCLRADLKRHMMIHSGNKPFQCILCNYKTSYKSHLNDHMLTHTVNKNLQCAHCNYRTKWKSSLKRHIHIHTHKLSLKEHTFTHRENKMYKCLQCEFQTTIRLELKNHNMLVHLVTEEMNKNRAKYGRSKQFYCLHCQYCTQYKSHLKDHMMTHNTYKPFQCFYCEYRTKWKSSLNRHMLVHIPKHSAAQCIV